MLELDPDMFEAYTEFSSVPWRTGTLEPKVKEFVYIAFDTAATHLYVKGLKLHIENAIGYGATAREILEVMEIASVLGIHGVPAAAPILQNRYAAQISAAVRGRLRYPDVAQSQGIAGVATVRFTLHRSGQVLSASLVRSAGHPALDRAALATVGPGSSLPPAPDGLPQQKTTFVVPLHFSLR